MIHGDSRKDKVRFNFKKFIGYCIDKLNIDLIDRNEPNKQICADQIPEVVINYFFKHILEWIFQGCKCIISSNGHRIMLLTVEGIYNNCRNFSYEYR